jgi:hypothetical protein
VVLLPAAVRFTALFLAALFFTTFFLATRLLPAFLAARRLVLPEARFFDAVARAGVFARLLCADVLSDFRLDFLRLAAILPVPK